MTPDSRPQSLCLASISFWLHPDIHSYFYESPLDRWSVEGQYRSSWARNHMELSICHKATFVFPSFFTLWLSEGVLHLYQSSIQKPGDKEKPIDNISILLLILGKLNQRQVSTQIAGVFSILQTNKNGVS